MATYYISTTGNNGNTGLVGQPWRNLSYAGTTATSVGDIIHILPGTFIETSRCNLAVGVSIEGEGATSIIKSHYVAGDKSDALILCSGGVNASQYIHDFKMDGDNLTADNAIVVYNRSNVHIYGVTVNDFDIQGVRFGGNTNQTGNVLYNSYITNSGGYDSDECGNLSLDYNTGAFIYGNSIIQNKRSSGNTGLGIQGSDELYGIKIYNNTITGTERTVSNNWSFAIEFWNVAKDCGHGLEIYGNTIKGEVDFGAGVTKGAYAYGVDFHNNTCGYEVGEIPSDLNVGRIALQFEEDVADVIVRHNTFKNVDRPLYFCSNGTAGQFENIWIYYNLINGVYYDYICQTTSAGFSAHGAGIIFGGAAFVYARNIYIWNNTITALVGRKAEIGIFLPTTGDCDDVYVQNNIIQGFSVAAISAEAQSGGGTLATLVIQNNLYYDNGYDGLKTVGFTPTGVTNTGNKTGNPVFVSSVDYHLQSTSPAVDSGVNLGLTIDRDGSSIGSPPEIGAYEYGSTIPVSAVTVTGAGGATTITVNGATLQMLAHIDPHNASNQTVTWSVVGGAGIINSAGLLTPITNGTVTVKATSNG
jgi:hypothetical protein